eukprot:scaffold168609_cov16-Tisochrysis_lutea.AAC.1
MLSGLLGWFSSGVCFEAVTIVGGFKAWQALWSLRGHRWLMPSLPRGPLRHTFSVQTNRRSSVPELLNLSLEQAVPWSLRFLLFLCNLNEPTPREHFFVETPRGISGTFK